MTSRLKEVVDQSYLTHRRKGTIDPAAGRDDAESQISNRSQSRSKRRQKRSAGGSRLDSQQSVYDTNYDPLLSVRDPIVPQEEYQQPDVVMEVQEEQREDTVPNLPVEEIKAVPKKINFRSVIKGIVKNHARNVGEMLDQLDADADQTNKAQDQHQTISQQPHPSLNTYETQHLFTERLKHLSEPIKIDDAYQPTLNNQDDSNVHQTLVESVLMQTETAQPHMLNHSVKSSLQELSQEVINPHFINETLPLITYRDAIFDTQTPVFIENQILPSLGDLQTFNVESQRNSSQQSFSSCNKEPVDMTFYPGATIKEDQRYPRAPQLSEEDKALELFDMFYMFEIEDQVISKIVHWQIERANNQIESYLSFYALQGVEKLLVKELMQDSFTQQQNTLEQQLSDNLEFQLEHLIIDELMNNQLQVIDQELEEMSMRRELRSQQRIDSLLQEENLISEVQHYTDIMPISQFGSGFQQESHFIPESVQDLPLTQHEPLLLSKETTLNQEIDTLHSINSSPQLDTLFEDAFDLVFFFLQKELFSTSIQPLEVHLQEVVTDFSVHTVHQQVVEQVYTSAVQEVKDTMYDRVLENIVVMAQQRVVERILGEILWLFEYAASQSVEQRVEDGVYDGVVDKIVNGQSDLNERLPKVRVIKREDIKNGVVSKKTKLKSSLKTKDVKLQNLLDIDFFEKCFFGKKLALRDQLTFRIYARELLDLIKSNLNKQIKHKYRIFADRKRQVKKIAERISRSKSPPSIYTMEQDIRGYFKKQSKTPPAKKRMRKLMKDNTKSHLNVTINTNQQPFEHFRTGSQGSALTPSQTPQNFDSFTNPENKNCFSASTLNPAEYQQRRSVSRKRHQPTQGGKSSPQRQLQNKCSQVKAYQTLESQIKEMIVKKKNGQLRKSSRLKRRIGSEQVSPRGSPFIQDNSSHILYNDPKDEQHSKEFDVNDRSNTPFIFQTITSKDQRLFKPSNKVPMMNLEPLQLQTFTTDAHPSTTTNATRLRSLTPFNRDAFALDLSNTAKVQQHTVLAMSRKKRQISEVIDSARKYALKDPSLNNTTDWNKKQSSLIVNDYVRGLQQDLDNKRKPSIKRQRRHKLGTLNQTAQNSPTQSIMNFRSSSKNLEFADIRLMKDRRPIVTLLDRKGITSVTKQRP